MKKLLAVLLASALFVPAFAGSIFNNVDTTGEIQTIGTLSRVQNGDGSTSDVSARLIFGLNMELVEDVHSVLTFASSNYWGTDSAYDSGASLNQYFDRVRVAEAYVNITNIFNAFELKAGRQFYGDESSAVMYFGPTHYRGRIPSTAPTTLMPASTPDMVSVDAAVVGYNSENFLANVVYAKVVEGNNGGVIGDVDQSVLGFDAKYFINSNLSLQAYLYDYRIGTGPGVTTERIGLWGAKAAYTDDAFKVGVEFAKNYYGVPRYFQYNELGWMAKADAAMTFATEAADLTPRVTYIHAEREFAALGNWGAGIFGGAPLFNYSFYGAGTNAEIVNAGVDFKFASLSKVTFSLDYYALKYGIGVDAAWLANEFDLMAKYALNEYVELHAGVAYLTNVHYGTGVDADKAYSGQLGMIVKF